MATLHCEIIAWVHVRYLYDWLYLFYDKRRLTNIFRGHIPPTNQTKWRINIKTKCLIFFKKCFLCLPLAKLQSSVFRIPFSHKLLTVSAVEFLVQIQDETVSEMCCIVAFVCAFVVLQGQSWMTWKSCWRDALVASAPLAPPVPPSPCLSLKRPAWRPRPSQWPLSQVYYSAKPFSVGDSRRKTSCQNSQGLLKSHYILERCHRKS